MYETEPKSTEGINPQLKQALFVQRVSSEKLTSVESVELHIALTTIVMLYQTTNSHFTNTINDLYQIPS